MVEWFHWNIICGDKCHILHWPKNSLSSHGCGKHSVDHMNWNQSRRLYIYCTHGLPLARHTNFLQYVNYGSQTDLMSIWPGVCICYILFPCHPPAEPSENFRDILQNVAKLHGVSNMRKLGHLNNFVKVIQFNSVYTAQQCKSGLYSTTPSLLTASLCSPSVSYNHCPYTCSEEGKTSTGTNFTEETARNSDRWGFFSLRTDRL